MSKVAVTRRPCDACLKRKAREPMGYAEFDEWANAKSKTHRQEQCPDCGRWTIWVKDELRRGR